MAYKVIILYRLYMPSYFLGTFTEYPYLKLPAKHHFLQPCSGQNTNHVIAYIKEHPQWRLSLQTHKLIDIP